MCGIILEKLVSIVVTGIVIIISFTGWEFRGVWTPGWVDMGPPTPAEPMSAFVLGGGVSVRAVKRGRQQHSGNWTLGATPGGGAKGLRAQVLRGPLIPSHPSQGLRCQASLSGTPPPPLLPARCRSGLDTLQSRSVNWHRAA